MLFDVELEGTHSVFLYVLTANLFQLYIKQFFYYYTKQLVYTFHRSFITMLGITNHNVLAGQSVSLLIQFDYFLLVLISLER